MSFRHAGTRTSAARALATGVTVVIVMALSTASASADFATTEYSRGSNNCDPYATNHVDPMGVVFYGYGAYAENYGHSHRTYDLVGPIWSWDPGPNTQYAGSHGVCTGMERERADNCGGCNRMHVRLNQTHHQDNYGRFETVGTPHFDQLTYCGHAVPPDDPSTSNPDSGFDEARGRLKNGWVNRYGSAKLGDIQNWGNTARRQQCNGWMTNGSGRVYWLKTD